MKSILKYTGLSRRVPTVPNRLSLVLVAPFLERFFQTLEMLDDNTFATVDQATRAVHLLQYLVSGQSDTAEHLLVFNKILCGLPINLPVPRSIELTQEEVELVNFLLQTVLQNWEIMKNSSVENLRGAFLLRDGRLVEEQGRWVLVVEAKSYDIVVDYLPWTISVLQLPWMEKRIEVDWKTKA
ncbi:MAG: hypothetical protein DA408_11685 [Bacteroidetes bacterium]|nr:MAG: hypothetical protein C7N36_12690 [Bacteroidota bacterium]PTM12176.1 MAG: hypothetical protein DA408_11685 [Bacteroidota bacterium]